MMRPQRGGCIAQMAAAIPAGEHSKPTPMTGQQQGFASEFQYPVQILGRYRCTPGDTRAEATALTSCLILHGSLSGVIKT